MMNLLVFLLAFSLQWTIGAIINLFPTGNADGDLIPKAIRPRSFFACAAGTAGLWYWGSGHFKPPVSMPQQPGPL